MKKIIISFSLLFSVVSNPLMADSTVASELSALASQMPEGLVPFDALTLDQQGGLVILTALTGICGGILTCNALDKMTDKKKTQAKKIVTKIVSVLAGFGVAFLSFKAGRYIINPNLEKMITDLDADLLQKVRDESENKSFDVKYVFKKYPRHDSINAVTEECSKMNILRGWFGRLSKSTWSKQSSWIEWGNYFKDMCAQAKTTLLDLKTGDSVYSKEFIRWANDVKIDLMAQQVRQKDEANRIQAERNRILRG